MKKFKLKNFFKAAYELILVFLQFFIIFLHFIKCEIPQNKQLIQVNPISNFLGIFTIIIALLVMLIAIKDLGTNLSPLPRPLPKSNLVTTGIYGLTRHPMYYSLILISFGVFLKNLSIYYLFLTISLALIIKFKINLEDHYLEDKFHNYFLYKNDVKF